MASLNFPTSTNTPLTLNDIFIKETINPQSRLSPTNGFVQDVALYILIPMLTPRLRGYMQPGVFNRASIENKSEWRPAGMRRKEITAHLFYPSDFIIDALGRNIIINYAKNCLMVVPEGKEEIKSVNIGIKPPCKGEVDFLEPVIDSTGRLYIIDKQANAVAAFSKNHEFEYHISLRDNTSSDEIPFSIEHMTIDSNDHLFLVVKNNHSSKIVKYTVEGSLLDTFEWAPSTTINGICFEPHYNRLFVLDNKGVSFFCFFQKQFYSFITSERNEFSKIKSDIEGNIYIAEKFGSLFVWDYKGKQLFSINLELSGSLFALNDKGSLRIFDRHGVITYDDETDKRDREPRSVDSFRVTNFADKTT